MVNRIVILQPSYLPWLGYFDQISKADYFVFLDDVLYTKNDWRNRNRIKTPTGPIWLTLPVDIKNRISQNLLIKDVKIRSHKIILSHLKSIEFAYKKSAFFNEIFQLLEKSLKDSYDFLSDLNIDTILAICNYLKITKTKFLKSSDLKIMYNSPSDRLVKICQNLNATNYLTGQGAKDYLDKSSFEKEKIEVEFQDYKHPVYTQLWGEFIPYLSIIDLLFNKGKESLDILVNKQSE